MKRFLLFAGNTYYARGGWHDFVGEFDSADVAVAMAEERGEGAYGWWHVLDSATGQIIHCYGEAYAGLEGYVGGCEGA